MAMGRSSWAEPPICTQKGLGTTAIPGFVPAAKILQPNQIAIAIFQLCVFKFMLAKSSRNLVRSALG